VEASLLVVRGAGASVTVSGSLTLNGTYTQDLGTTTFEAGTVTVGDLFDIRRGDVLGQPQPGDALQVVQFGAGTGTFAHVRVNAPLYGVLYVFEPRDGVQPGVMLLF
jgi:hypothetical protein